jgi:hypothetical protein
MWKDLPSEDKRAYQERAAAAQEEFTAAHPNYTYRKAQRKRSAKQSRADTNHGLAPFYLQMLAYCTPPPQSGKMVPVRHDSDRSQNLLPPE